MAEKRTGGARFDPAEGFCYFAAAAVDSLKLVAQRHDHVLVALNDLTTLKRRQSVDEVVNRSSSRTLLDSGIFWLATTHAAAHGLTMDQALAVAPQELDGWDRLTGAYIDVVRAYEDRLWGYVELDQGGADNKRKTRAWLESEGLRPIPVYHPLTDGWAYFDELLDAGYDRIMVGNVVQASWQVRDRLLYTVWERVRRARRRPWIHLLGLGPYATLAACPVNSSDTSNHVQAMQYGALIPGAMAMGPFSKLYGYLYDPTQPVDAPSGLAGFGHLLGWIAACDELSWRTQQDELARAVGLERYPKPVPREAVPVPEAA